LEKNEGDEGNRKDYLNDGDENVHILGLGDFTINLKIDTSMLAEIAVTRKTGKPWRLIGGTVNPKMFCELVAMGFIWKSDKMKMAK
jgi:hypothetical protein